MKKVILLILVFLISCQTTNNNVDMGDIESPKDYTPAKVEIMPSTYEVLDLIYIDTDQYLFLQKSNKNNNSQIYLGSYKTKKNRRMTFERSSNLNFTYSPQEKLIYYTSQMHETKDDPYKTLTSTKEILNPEIQHLHPLLYTPSFSDIYSLSLNESLIHRMTQFKGYEGEPTASPKNSTLVYTRFINNKYKLFSLNTQNMGQSEIFNSNLNQRFPKISKLNSIVFIEYDEKNPFTEVYFAKTLNDKKIKLNLPPAIYVHPTLNSLGTKLLLSANVDDAQNFEIYAFDLETECLERLTYNKSQDIHPNWMEEEGRISFISDRNGKKQPFLMNYIPHKTCPKPMKAIQ